MFDPNENMNEGNIVLTKLIQKCQNTEDKKYYIYVRSKWINNSVELLLQETHMNKCYKCKVTHDDIFESAAELEIPFEKFFNECKTALTSKIGSKIGFEFEIESGEAVFKLIKKDNFDIVYLMINLEVVENNYEMLDHAIDMFHENREKTERSEKVGILNESDRLLKTFDDSFQSLLDNKKKQEIELFKKFILLLNSKKAKIKELQDELSQVRKSTDHDIVEQESSELNRSLSSTPISARKNKTRNNKLRIADVDENDDDFDAMTQPISPNATATLNSKYDDSTDIETD